MNPEDMKELKELIEFLKDNQIGEFDLDRGDLKVRIKFAQQGTSAADLGGVVPPAERLCCQRARTPGRSGPCACSARASAGCSRARGCRGG